LIRDTQHALKLFRANALFAGAHQVHCVQPNVKRNLAALENGAHGNRKLLAAVFALPQAGTVGFALKAVMVRAYGAAVRAYPAIGPADVFKPLAGFGFVFELVFIQDRFGHGFHPQVCQ
jgi:hypothetical protein